MYSTRNGKRGSRTSVKAPRAFFYSGVAHDSRNRYYRTELAENAAKKLSTVIDGALGVQAVEALAGRVKQALNGTASYEKTQLERGLTELSVAREAHQRLRSEADGGVSARI